MVKKILLLLTAAIFLAVYCICLSDGLIKRIAKFKYGSESAFASDKYRYGDLYGMSYVPAFKMKEDRIPTTVPAQGGPKNIDLYTICDSYIWDFVQGREAFAGVAKYKVAKTNSLERITVSLDTARENVLLLEFAERNMRIIMYSEYMHNAITVVPDAHETTQTEAAEDRIKISPFNPNVNTNLEFLLWDSRLLTPLKEIKGYICSVISKKINTDVLMSDNNEELFLWETVDPADTSSSFVATPGWKVDKMVNTLNELSDYYKGKGFDRVLISLIPNPISMEQPRYLAASYNQLIPRVQNHPQLKAEIIDVYSLFKNTEKQVYLKGDTHWNAEGFLMWLEVVNKKLNTYKKQ